MLFWIALSNFVIPALFSLAQIVIVFADGNLLSVNLIILVNTSVSIIGVVFATIWTATAREDRDAVPARPHASTIVFEPTDTALGTGTIFTDPARSRAGQESMRTAALFESSAVDLKDPEKGETAPENVDGRVRVRERELSIEST